VAALGFWIGTDQGLQGAVAEAVAVLIIARSTRAC
jgi:hypothetical protein